VVCIDNSGNILFSNSKAHRLLKIKSGNSPTDEIGKYFDDLFLNQVLRDGLPRVEAITSINKEKLVVSALPITIHARMHGAVALFRDVASLQNINRRIREELHVMGLVSHYTVQDIKGKSVPVQRLISKIRRYAPSDASVLIQGESGSGKELVAHSLHQLSNRKSQPFVAVNCAALPESLLESELFGYEEGAFTGAKRGGKIGLFEMANHGTIFLDEIGEISHGMQLRLLRVLEAKELMRVGGDRIVPVDVRILCASHKDIREMVREKQFRLDLCYRLGVIQLHIPPLRQRLEDVPQILHDLFSRYGKGPESLTPGMLDQIRQYGWPGNVRELQALLESYLILLGGEKADEDLFTEMFYERAIDLRPNSGRVEGTDGGDGALRDRLETFRRQIVLDTVGRCGMDRQQAAKELGISYNTLWRILASR
jgi:propionate catabolism operon transcriptional regulator